jgi:tetrahydromethanopterin S-methyltransferase subunit G
MSEDETKTLDAKLLQQILAKLDVMDTRLQFVEGKIRERGFDTKPIWQRALAEIMEVKQRLSMVDRKLDVFSSDMLNLRAEQLDIQERLRKLEATQQDGGTMTIN